MSHHIVEVKDLSHVYPDGTTAVRDVSLRIIHGESVAIVGANVQENQPCCTTSTGILHPHPVSFV